MDKLHDLEKLTIKRSQNNYLTRGEMDGQLDVLSFVYKSQNNYLTQGEMDNYEERLVFKDKWIRLKITISRRVRWI